LTAFARLPISRLSRWTVLSFLSFLTFPSVGRSLLAGVAAITDFAVFLARARGLFDVGGGSATICVVAVRVVTRVSRGPVGRTSTTASTRWASTFAHAIVLVKR